MAMELKMIAPRFSAHPSADGKAANWYTLCFSGWEHEGNVDEDGNVFSYFVECEDLVWNCAHAYVNGYSWFFEKIWDDYRGFPDSQKSEDADFSDEEVEFLIHTMLEAIKNGGLE